MATFYARIRPKRENRQGQTNILISVNHKGATRYLATDYYIEPDMFDNKRGRVKGEYSLAGDMNIELQALELSYARKALKLEGRIKTISIAELLLFLEDTDKTGALNYFSVSSKRVEYHRGRGKKNTADLIERTEKLIQEYSGTDNMPFMKLNPGWLRNFETWYLKRGSQNSAAIHLRNIRMVFNLAIDDYGLSPEYYPFRKFKIRHEQTIHRDLDLVEIARLVNHEPKTASQEVARDLWLLSFFMVGINFIDLLLAEKSDVKKGRLVYRRAKTGTMFSVKIEPEAQALIDKYQGEKYLLNFMEHKQRVQEKKDRKTPLHKDVTDQTNRQLKKLAAAINTVNGEYVENIAPKLSTYFSRHAWASNGSKLDISRDIIREALGHSRSVTDVYINFYVPKIDQANRVIIDALFKACQPA